MADEKEVSSDERYRYIGFEIFGGKPADFWTNDEERKDYIQRVREELGSIYRNSVIYSAVLGKSDRIFITIASAVMVIAPFLPWMSARTLYGTASFLGLTGVFNLSGFWFYVSKMGGMVIPLTVYLLGALALMSLVLGGLTLAAVYRKAASPEAYLARLKKTLRLSLIPTVTFLVIFILSLIGQRIPFGEHLGIEGLTGRYSIATLISYSSIGLWLTVFGSILNFNKSREL